MRSTLLCPNSVRVTVPSVPMTMTGVDGGDRIWLPNSSASERRKSLEPTTYGQSNPSCRLYAARSCAPSDASTSTPIQVTRSGLSPASAVTASRCWARQLAHQIAIVSMNTTRLVATMSAIRKDWPVRTSVRWTVAQAWVSTTPAGAVAGAPAAEFSAGVPGVLGGGAGEVADGRAVPLEPTSAAFEQAATTSRSAVATSRGRIGERCRAVGRWSMNFLTADFVAPSVWARKVTRP